MYRPSTASSLSSSTTTSAPRIRRGPSPPNVLRAASPAPMDDPLPGWEARLEETANLYAVEIHRKRFDCPDSVRDRADEARRVEEVREHDRFRSAAYPPMCYEERGPQWEPPTPPPYRSSKPPRPPIWELFPPQELYRMQRDGTLSARKLSRPGSAREQQQQKQTPRTPRRGGAAAAAAAVSGGDSSLSSSAASRPFATPPSTPKNQQQRPFRHTPPTPQQQKLAAPSSSSSSLPSVDDTNNNQNPNPNSASNSTTNIPSPSSLNSSGRGVRPSVVTIIDPALLGEAVKDLETVEFRTRMGISQAERPERDAIVKKYAAFRKSVDALETERGELVREEAEARAKLETGEDQQQLDKIISQQEPREREAVTAAEEEKKARAAKEEAERQAAHEERKRQAIAARDSEEGISARKAAIDGGA